MHKLILKTIRDILTPIFLILFFHSTLFAASINLTSEEKKWLENHPKIVFGTDSNWQPYIIVDEEGKHSGVEQELINLINEIAGTNIELMAGSWTDILQKAKNKQIDGLALSVAHEKRKKDFVFSEGLYNIYKYIFTFDKDIKSMDDLKGKTVAYLKGNMLELNLLNKIQDIKLVAVKDDKEHIKLLKDGKVDAIIGGINLRFNSTELIGSDLAFSVPNSESTIVYSIRKDYKILQSIINKALIKIPYSKRVTILEKWGANIHSKGSSSKVLLTQEEKTWLNNNSVIKMCVLPNWMPFEQIDKNKKHNGIAQDLTDLISTYINTPIELVPTKEWSQSLKNIRERKCDILPVAMDIPSRRDAMNFTKPYWKEPFVIATKQDKFFIKDSKGIGNKKIGIVKSYAFIDVLKLRNPDIQIVEVKNVKEGLDKVRSGELFGYIDIMAAIGYNIQKYGFYDIKIAGKLEFTIDLSIASRNDIPILNSIMQKTLDQIGQDRIRTIVGKWIEIKVQQVFDYTKLFYVIGIFSIIFIMIMYKNRSIKNINKKLEKANEEIKEQKKLADSLTQYQQTLLSLFDKSDAVLFKFSWNNELNWDAEYVSLSINKLLGYESREFTNQEISYISCIHPDDVEVVKDELNKNLNLGVVYFKHEPYRVITKDGEVKWVLDYIVALKNESGNITHILGYITDITDYIKQQNLVLQQSKMASLGEMIGNISHQWRQPLSVISTVATGTKLKKELNGLDDKELIENMDLINNNAQFLSKTIDDFKNFIKGERVLVEFNIYEVIEQVLSLVKASISNNYINVILDCDKDITIKGYPNEFIQSIINIYNNAKDVLVNLPEEERFFFITLKRKENGVILILKDNGGGVDKKIIDKIFEPYTTTKHKSMGTGLGLNITYNFIVTGMNGTITVENVNYYYNNKRYNGAKFNIFIPTKNK